MSTLVHKIRLRTLSARSQKIPAPIKIKLAFQNPPPPKLRNFMGMEVLSCRKNQKAQAPIKLAQPFPGPESRAKHFADMRLFLRKNKSHPLARAQGWRSCGLPSVHQWIFSSRRSKKASNSSQGPLVHDPQQQSPAWVWNAAAEGLRLRGRSISSGARRTNMIKNMSFQGPTNQKNPRAHKNKIGTSP